MVKVLETKRENIKLVIMADRKSKDGMYVDCAGNPKKLDENYILREVYSFKDAPANKRIRKELTLTIKLSAISNNILKASNARSNKWVNKNYSKVNQKPVTTMLNNKGWN